MKQEDKKEKILIDFPGGSTLAPMFIGSTEVLYSKGIKPDVIITVSVTSLLSIHLAMGFKHRNLLKIASKVARKVKPSTIWAKRKNPFNEEGDFNVTGKWRLITMQPSFGIQDTTRVFKEYVSAEMFQKYKKGVEFGHYPEVFITTWDWKTKKQIFHRVADMTYGLLVLTAEASAHIDTITNPIWIPNFGWQFDPGRIDQNAGHKFLNGDCLNFDDIKQYTEGIGTVYSQYPRKDFKEEREPCSWFIVNDSSLKASVFEGSKGDEAQMYKICHQIGIGHFPIILNAPDIPTYETNNEIMEQLYQDGINQTKEQLK